MGHMKTPLLAALGAATLFLHGSLFARDLALQIRVGMKDSEPTRWDGSLEVSGAQVRSLEGWRFEQKDSLTGPSSWQFSTREVTERKSRSSGNLRNALRQRKVRIPMNDNGLLVRLTQASPETSLQFKTAAGDFAFSLRDLRLGQPLQLLDGKVEALQVADAQPLSTGREDDDCPALTIAPDGRWLVAWVSFTPGLDRDERAKSLSGPLENFDFLTAPPGGDQIWLRSRSPEGDWGAPVAVTEKGRDVSKCAVAVDGAGCTWVVFSERENGAFAVKARKFDSKGQPGETVQLSTGTGNHHSPVAVAGADGRIWAAWQGADAEGLWFHIWARHQTDQGWSEVLDVSGPAAGHAWSPELAAGRGDQARVAVVWDTYDAGDYDVLAREFTLSGSAGDILTVVNSTKYEARPTACYDAAQRLWVAYEEGGPSWGKDWGAYDPNDGIGLYKQRQIAVRVRDGSVWKQPAASIALALRVSGKKGKAGTAGAANEASQAQPSAAENSRKAGEEAGEDPGKRGAATVLNNQARIAADGAGRIWLLSRSREGSFHTPVGGVWMGYASWLNGDRWSGPVLLPHSDNFLYNRPGVAATPLGIAIAHSTDHRQDRVTEWLKSRQSGKAGNASLAATRDPFDNDVYISTLGSDAASSAPVLVDAEPPQPKQPSPATLAEREAIQRVRAYRATVQGTPLRILRGEFHRHTELSGDGMGDGALEDMWRYALDVAGMDWVGNGDHDNGGGREYPWWITQKTTDAFHLPGRFDPLFSYERSVSYPEGHRNVIFVQRGVRTLPRLPISNRNLPAPAPDTQMLYRYLRRFDGICASHTSATDMGTDWRDNDPVVEPFVEIYQGARQNYERPGAPRCPSENDAIGGWEPKGFVNLALLKGYRMSFQASSDHGSTHISYCLVYAKDASRQSIFDAMKARHTYGATDNIVADLRGQAGSQEFMMGDALTSSEAPVFHLKLIGTSPFAKVTLIKDDQEVHTWSPGQAVVDLSWTGQPQQAGSTSYYYFRGEQENTELVWVSPVWITGK